MLGAWGNRAMGVFGAAAGLANKGRTGFNLWAMKNPVGGFAALGAMGAAGITAAGGLAGGISPMGTMGGGAGGIWSGAILGGIGGVMGKAAYNMGRTRRAMRGFSPAMRGAAVRGAGGWSRIATRGMTKFGAYGLMAGALLGATLSGNSAPNRIRGLHR
jgi:hypothetical protein